MPAATTLARVGRFEFFAILAPGVCLVAVTTLFIAACMAGTTQNASETIIELSKQVKKQWPLGVTLLLFAYLVGSILRAIPVNFVDKACGRIFKRFAGSGFDRYVFEGGFPYLRMMEAQLEALRINGLPHDFAAPAKGTSHTTFNFWKLMLCDQSPATFEYAQELEARVRLFSGMIWTALPGAVMGVFGILFSRFGAFHSTWLPVMSGITLVSLLFLVLLGWRLRGVRAEEVQAIFFGALNLHLKRRQPAS